jgi:hypothetical protein
LRILRVFIEALRAGGPLLLGGGALVIAAGLLYWAAGWRYGAVIAIWASEWGLPVVGLGAGLTWLEKRAAGGAAVGSGLAGMLLIIMGEVTGAYGSYTVPCGALDAVAILLGAGILLGHGAEPK